MQFLHFYISISTPGYPGWCCSFLNSSFPMIVIIAVSSFHYIWFKYPIFYFSSASSALFLPMLFKHCVLKALIHSASDGYLVLSNEFKDEIGFQSPSGQCLSSTYTKKKNKLRRQRMGNRWKVKLEKYNIHKMQWSRIHLPFSQSASVFMSLMPTCRTAKSLFLFLTAGDCSWPTPTTTNAKTGL